MTRSERSYHIPLALVAFLALVFAAGLGAALRMGEAQRFLLISAVVIVLVPYRRVAEGLNLQCIDTVIWFELAMNLFHLDQVSRCA